jgi:GNAT superfamily N-acetyltransferase
MRNDTETLRLVPATAEHAELLSEMAYRSEAHWGNDDEYMDQFRLHYNLTAKFISENPVYLLEENCSPVGFWGLVRAENGWELEFFYIDVRLIGKGYGRMLWDSLIGECGKIGVESFEFVTSPEAERFYTKMGAKTVGHVESLIRKGRIIPKLQYEMKKKAIPK